MPLNNEQKRELALAFVKCPEHYRPNNIIKDSHLCRFKNNVNHVIVCVKSVDTGKKNPCIGFYFYSSNKKNFLNELSETLPGNFHLDANCISDKKTGWVTFCRDDCKTAEEMYRQIVSPGSAMQDWLKMFEWLKTFGRDHFGCQEEYYTQENWNATPTNNGTGLQMNQNEEEQVMSVNEKIKKLLLATGQIILHGAPGTGKTYLARQIAAELTGDALDGDKHPHVEMVQFHAGYDYSDFVVGLKPKLIGEQGKESVSFEWKRGIFSQFADEARMAYDKATDKSQAPKYVFIIDEINRADLSRVFGELFSQIEWGYRYREGGNTIGVKLPDGKEPLLVPENLYIIGTMNDIDRSVESMDFALRRRFAWYEITAMESEGIIDVKVSDQALCDKVKNVMRAINGVIRDPENGLGSEYEIGGAIFANIINCGQDFQQLWEVYIQTILKEYLRGNKHKDELLGKMKKAYFDAVTK